MKERCRRDLIAGQYEIKTRHHQRGEGGPFFDGYAIGKARDQSEESPNDEKYQSGDNGHVIAGNRQHVADAGNEQGVIDICRDGVVPAVDQHRGNRAAIAGKNRANARVDGVAQPLNERVGALKWPFRARRRNHLDGAAYETRGADALEKQVSREVVATRFERLQRRLERRFDFHERTRRGRRAAFDRKPHALGPYFHAAALDPLDPRHETIGVLAFFAQLDKARDCDARGRKAQHRMGDERRLERRHRKAQRNPENAERDRMGGKASAQRYGDNGANAGQYSRRPKRRLAFGREVKHDAGAESDREPRQKPSRRGFLGRPFVDLCGRNGLPTRPVSAPARSQPAAGPRPPPRRRPRHRARRRSHARSIFQPVVLCHCAAPTR